jgi:hypothetical protein
LHYRAALKIEEHSQHGWLNAAICGNAAAAATPPTGLPRYPAMLSAAPG